MPLRLLSTPPLDGATNMALDEALLARARRTGEIVVRVYRWTRPTLSLGRHQAARGVYDAARAAAHGIDVVRRPTGGRAVLHWREVTYSVTAPSAALSPAGASPRAAYARINSMLADALSALGVAAAPAIAHGRARRPDGVPCFEAPAAGELVAGADARKLVGSAQWRECGALLQHGSILIDDDQGLLACCARGPIPPFAPPATLHALLGRAPATDEVAVAVLDAARRLAESLDLPVVAIDPDALADDPALRAEVARLLPRYTESTWTWRR
ncbi:hypothetical protein tb265_33530 [Gemmatimonadetes bacterium T265]|nr:hypothetical protein tb265_33530 [Gemmatimonadetes bacterium T265]